MVILDSCPDQESSEFYAKRAAQEGWTRSVLQAMIATRLHERTQPALTTFDQAIPEDDRDAVGAHGPRPPERSVISGEEMLPT